MKAEKQPTNLTRYHCPFCGSAPYDVSVLPGFVFCLDPDCPIFGLPIILDAWERREPDPFENPWLGLKQVFRID